MSKIGILVPYQVSVKRVKELLKDYPKLNVIDVRNCYTKDAAEQARQMEREGCDILIGRGLQASLMKQAVSAAVIEIRVTSQELAVVALRLKQDLGIEHPRIALIGYENMLADTSMFDELYGIEIERVLVQTAEMLSEKVREAVWNGFDAVIGGNTVCEAAIDSGVPAQNIPSGDESLRNAFLEADRVAYAIDLSRMDTAEMEAVLDNTFTGIMQIDLQGRIKRINRAGYEILECRQGEPIGKSVREVIPGLNPVALKSALEDGRETFATLVEIKKKEAVVNVAPIEVDKRIDGAILTFQEGRNILEMDTKLRMEMYQRGQSAKFYFDDIRSNDELLTEALQLARRVSGFSAPVLLVEEQGSRASMIASCIHNEGMQHRNAFISVDCSAWMPETLDDMLFGNYSSKSNSPLCLAEIASEGTLYIEHVEYLGRETQYKLFNLIRGRFMHNGSNRIVSEKVRVIASTSANLVAAIERGDFRRDLYYALNVLSIDIPPLRKQKANLRLWTDSCLNKWQNQYKRYIHMTENAYSCLSEYDWPGNLDQLDSVCERIVLLTQKRNVDAVFVRRQIEQVVPDLLPGTETVVVYKDRKAASIAELLKQHGGNREKVAAELGISKTTLWRYMKKYGITSDYRY